MAGPKVLVVDDEASILTSTAALLQDIGYRVATCSRAQEIREAIAREEPDVVLQDVRMPGLDLEGLVMGLRADPRWRRLPVVLFTASMDADEIAERLGARAVLEKPFKMSELRRVLDEAVASVQA